MLFYWTLFFVPSLASLSPVRLERNSRAVMVAVIGIFLVLAIGLRDNVGADWSGYSIILRTDENLSLFDLLTAREPGFGLINWISIELNWGLYGVNFFCAVIFVAGLLAFLNRQPNFWRCLALAIPVLVIQLGMSGIRQAAAMGFLFFALNAFMDRRVLRFFFFVLLAATIHQTAILFALLGGFILGRIRIGPSILAGLVLAFVALFLLRDTEIYGARYIQGDASAAGAWPRAAFNVIAVALFWLFSKPWAASYPQDHRLFGIFAVATVLVTPLIPFADVAVDRLEYYLIPFQIAVIGRAPEFMSPRMRSIFTPLVIAGYAGALAVWMNFSWIAQSGWMPYQSALFQHD
jgi:hypothetical protein